MNTRWVSALSGEGIRSITLRLFAPFGLGMLDQILISFVGLLATILVARAVSITDFGAYSLAMIGILLVSSVQNSLIIAPHAVLAAPLRDNQFREATSSALVAQLCLSGLALGVMAVTGIASLAFSDQIMPVFLAAAVASAVIQIQEFFRRILYCRFDVKGALLNNVVCFGILVPALVALSLVNWLTIVRAMLLMALSAFVAATYGFLQTRSLLSPQTDRPELRFWWMSGWKIGKWLLGSSMLGWATTSLFPVLIAGFIGLGAVAALRAAQSLLGLTNVVFRFLDTTLLPSASALFEGSGQTELNRFLKSVWLAALPVFLVIVVLSLFLGRTAISHVFGTEYADDAWIVIPLSLGLVLTLSSSVLGLGMKAMHQTDAQFFAYLLAAIVNLTVGVGVVKVFELPGAVAGILLSSAIITAVMITRFRRANHHGSYTGLAASAGDS